MKPAQQVVTALLDWQYPRRERSSEPELTAAFDEPVGRRLRQSARMFEPDLEACPNCGELYDLSLGYCPTCTPSSQARTYVPDTQPQDAELPTADEVKRILNKISRKKAAPPPRPPASAPAENPALSQRRKAAHQADLLGLESAAQCAVDRLLETSGN